ncbi:MAG: DUF4340 domain-containing protein [Calditrichaceae bacterium]
MRKTIIILFAALGLAALFFLFEIDGGNEQKSKSKKAEKLFRTEMDNINLIEIIRQNEHIVLAKDKTGWRIERPVLTGADRSSIISLLQSLVDAKIEKPFPARSEQMSQYGLTYDATMIVLTGINGSKDSVKIGNDFTAGEKIYVSLSDSVVCLTGSNLKKNAGKSLYELRDKKVTHFEMTNIQTILLKNQHGNFEFIKDGSDWMLSRPLRTKADQSLVENMLNNLNSSRIISVASEHKTRLNSYGLSNPAVSIELRNSADELESGVRFSIPDRDIIYGADEKRTLIYEVDSSFVNSLNKNIYDFRHKKILDFNLQKADRINLLYKGNLLTLFKDTLDVWQLQTGEKVKIREVENILNTLINLTVKKFVAEKPTYLFPYGLTSPAGMIEIFAGDMRTAELEIGIREKGIVYVKNPLDGDVVAVDEAVLDEIFKSKNDLIIDDNLKESSER